MYNENAKNSTIKYRRAHRDSLTLDFPRGYKAKFRAYAQSKGMTLTALIIYLITRDMEAAGFEYAEEETEDEGESG